MDWMLWSYAHWMLGYYGLDVGDITDWMLGYYRLDMGILRTGCGDITDWMLGYYRLDVGILRTGCGDITDRMWGYYGLDVGILRTGCGDVTYRLLPRRNVWCSHGCPRLGWRRTSRTLAAFDSSEPTLWGWGLKTSHIIQRIKFYGIKKIQLNENTMLIEQRTHLIYNQSRLHIYSPCSVGCIPTT